MEDDVVIRQIPSDSTGYPELLAALLYEAFRPTSPHSWPTMADAMGEVWSRMSDANINLIACQRGNPVCGWISAAPQYEGKVWEVHPLVVHAEFRGMGIGTRLVHGTERLAGDRGGVTLWVGTDDEVGGTTLFGKDLYPEPLEALRTLRSKGAHPLGF
jgi:aminoglycoside 6'-N-acetyltransferase I